MLVVLTPWESAEGGFAPALALLFQFKPTAISPLSQITELYTELSELPLHILFGDLCARDSTLQRGGRASISWGEASSWRNNTLSCYRNFCPELTYQSLCGSRPDSYSFVFEDCSGRGALATVSLHCINIYVRFAQERLEVCHQTRTNCQ